MEDAPIPEGRPVRTPAKGPRPDPAAGSPPASPPSTPATRTQELRWERLQQRHAEWLREERTKRPPAAGAGGAGAGKAGGRGIAFPRPSARAAGAKSERELMVEATAYYTARCASSPRPAPQPLVHAAPAPVLHLPRSAAEGSAARSGHWLPDPDGNWTPDPARRTGVQTSREAAARPPSAAAGAGAFASRRREAVEKGNRLRLERYGGAPPGRRSLLVAPLVT